MEYEVRAENLDGLSAFVRGYLETAEWCGLDDACECGAFGCRHSGDDGHTPGDRVAFNACESPRWSDAALASAKSDCEDFQASNAETLDGLDEAQTGHDFWLTRNGHGCGFWDGDYPEPTGDLLTAASKPYGTVNVYFNAASGTLELS